jgi:protein-L-isoaspartate O-methyltransferase
MTTASSHQAVRLASDLLSAGRIDESWAEAFAAAPRDLFLPAFYSRSGDSWQLITPGTVGRQQWLKLVYSDVTWVQRLDGPHHLPGTPACSCIQPSLAARLLTILPVTPGARICEIGSGTGWLTAILSHRYGASQVTGIELDPDLIRQASATLTELGYQPQLICADGYNGDPDAAPYDAILSTAAVTRLPSAWLRQTRPGGRIVTPLRGGIAVMDVQDHDNATGRFLAGPVQILPLRSPHHHPRNSPATSNPPQETDPRTIARALHDSHFRFVLELRHPDLIVTEQELLGELILSDLGGSSARFPPLGNPEPQEAPLLWQALNDAYLEWQQAGRPGPSDITLEVEHGLQWARVSPALRWQLR